jgi:signal transduction histidine kinase
MRCRTRSVRVANTGQAESAEITLDTMWRDAIHVRGVWVHTVLPFGPGLMSVAFDVTEERRREAELRNFAAVAAHDLREPLVGIHWLAGLLSRQSGLGAKEQEMVRLLDQGVERARNLVDNILVYAKAADDSGSRADVDAGAVMTEVLAALASQIEAVDGRVEVADLPTLHASRTGLSRIFQNLIANALKFQNGDAPRVTVSARQGQAGWTFSVRDNGIGLPKDTQIFEMFKRGGGANDGSGIGLATCRRIVEGHGGRIWAEPAPGGGSIFSFTLPSGVT